MTAPPVVDSAAPPRVVSSVHVAAPRRPSRPQAAAAAPPTDWHCENCSHHNAARRRRCLDCGTSRC